MFPPDFDKELEEVREIGEKVALFAQLRFHALAMGRKQGWAAYFYKSIHGTWPDRAWEKVPPMRPTENTMALIEARDRRFVFEQRIKRQREERERLIETAGGTREEFVEALMSDGETDDQ